MPSVVRITNRDFPQIHAQFLQSLNPEMPVSVWRRMFETRGWSSEDCCGFALMLRGQYVGLLGALFSDRDLGGKRQRFCNLHSWYVNPAYRGPSSLVLLRAVLDLPDTVLTDFSASPEVGELLDRLGFVSLGNELTVMPAIPFSRMAAKQVIDIEAVPAVAERLLAPADLRIFRDHLGIECRHLLVEDAGGEYCYVVASGALGGPVAHAHVHFVSQPRIFARHHLSFRHAMMAGGARYAVVPTRLLHGTRVPLSFVGHGDRTLCRPAAPPQSIDSLYSEMALLKLPVVPRVPAWMRWGKRWVQRVLRRK